MEGVPSGRSRLLRVERGYECCRMEGTLVATAYEDVVPLLRRELVVTHGVHEQEGVEGYRQRATVGV